MNQRRRLYLRFGNAHNSQVNPENVEEQDYQRIEIAHREFVLKRETRNNFFFYTLLCSIFVLFSIELLQSPKIDGPGPLYDCGKQHYSVDCRSRQVILSEED